MNAATQQAQASRGDQLVTVMSEDGDGSFLISRMVLRTASQYFVEALEDEPMDMEELRLTLPGCDWFAVKMLGYWLYHGSLPDFFLELFELAETDPDYGRDITHEYDFYHKQRLVPLARVWVLAERLSMPKLQNEAVRRILGLTANENMPVDTLLSVFKIAPPESKLRDLFLLECLFYCQRDWLPREHVQELDKAIPNFAVDVLMNVREMRRRYGRDAQKAHMHGIQSFLVPCENGEEALVEGPDPATARRWSNSDTD